MSAKVAPMRESSLSRGEQNVVMANGTWQMAEKGPTSPQAAPTPLTPLPSDGRGGPALLTRQGLAEALCISVSTVDRMLADGEITPVRLRGKLVRFCLPDVIAELKQKAQTSKRNCTRRI